MIRLLKGLYENKVAEIEAKTAQLTLEENTLKEASNIVTDRPDKNGFVRMYSVNDREKGHIQTNQIEAVRKSREFDRWDPHAHGILNTLQNYIMGKGIRITPKADDPMTWWVWREFSIAERNKWVMKQFEIVRRVFRDGEIFIRFFSKDESGAETGKTTIRFLDPLMIRAKGDLNATNAQTTINNGVNTDPDDIEDVISYTLQDRVDDTKFIDIPADEILHIKINADSDQKRGEPAYQQLLAYFRYYEQWLENRIILNKIRTALVMFRKVEGTPTEVSAMAAKLPAATRTVPNGDSKTKNIRPGTVVTEGPGVTHRMESANINATDAKEDGRNIKLAMAANMNMPEYIFGDASNANYSSTMVAESPFVKMIQFYQIVFEYYFGQIYRRVIQNAVNAKLLEAPNDDEFVNKLKAIRDIKEADDGDDSKGLSARDQALKELMPEGKMESPSEIFYGCDMDWPEVIHRDIKEQVDALTVARQGGWVSDSTASAALGYDYSEEVRKQRQIEEDAEMEDNPLLASGGSGDAGDMSAEMNDMLAGLTPDERTQILNSKDPKEIAAILGKRSSGGSGDSGANGNGGDE